MDRRSSVRDQSRLILLGDADQLPSVEAGAVFRDRHEGNPHGWYIHPHFMAFFKRDLGGLVVLRKLRGDATDSGEEATLRVLAAGFEVAGLAIEFCPRCRGPPARADLAGGVFHAWYTSAAWPATRRTPSSARPPAPSRGRPISSR
jgi:hypothetical protein